MTDKSWGSFLEHAHNKFPKDSFFLSVLPQMKPIEETGNIITIGCPTIGIRFYGIQKKTIIEQLLSEFLENKIITAFVLTEKKKRKKDDPPLIQYEPSIDDIITKCGILPKHSFKNYAVSPSNQVAYAAAEAVAENPGHIYNPLFIYGGVGVGKTHLAQAVGRAILEKNNTHKVLFSPGDTFTNELVEAIRGKKTEQFRRKYRNIQLLIVDDIQFISGKNSIQEEFFHTFNTIKTNGGQIILTSDRAPHEIQDIEDRLRSRFAGGLTIDIQQPDFELRSAIVLIKAADRNINITMDAVQAIAANVIDARSLEGSLISIYARVAPFKQTIEKEDVDAQLQSDLTKPKQKRTSHSDVIKAVCNYYNIKQTQIKSPTRAEKIAFPRQVIMYILRYHLDLKLEEIAQILKRKDHTTIIHGSEKVRNNAMNDHRIQEDIDKIVQELHIST